jgi:hypothetical protein
MPTFTRFLPAGVIAVCLASPSQAADSWKHEVIPYLFAAGMAGKTAIGPVDADVDVGFGDILDHLDWGAMLAYRGTKGPWSIGVDAIYMDLQVDKDGPRTPPARAEAQQTAIELDVGYAIAESVEAFAGLRYNDIDLDLRIVGAGPLGEDLTAGGSESWTDPVIGMRATHPINDKWSVGLRGDIGGFGIGSDFAWQAVAHVRWQATPSVAAIAAYRYFEQDYEDGTPGAAGYFKYDVATSGPCLGVSFTF